MAITTNSTITVPFDLNPKELSVVKEIRGSKAAQALAAAVRLPENDKNYNNAIDKATTAMNSFLEICSLARSGTPATLSFRITQQELQFIEKSRAAKQAPSLLSRIGACFRKLFTSKK